MRIALATCPDRPSEFDDDERLVDALRARGATPEWANWRDDLDWNRFDRVIVRSPWDYTHHHAAFVAWCERIGDRLRNRPEVIRWNSDKHYLADLDANGVPTVPTAFVEPGVPAPALSGELVVKPSISAGARDTGRFGPTVHDRAHHLIEAITSSGRTAMVQPFLDSVNSSGETSVVAVAGEPSHVLRKRAVLAADEVAPVRAGGIGAAESMYDPELVRAAQATPAQLELTHATLQYVSARFGHMPLFARVDMLGDDRGQPVVLELEAIEPCLYLHEAPATANILADAILAGG